ncbi:hypothetical protein ACHAXT_009825 [Thalassiosira profunda]
MTNLRRSTRKRGAGDVEAHEASAGTDAAPAPAAAAPTPTPPLEEAPTKRMKIENGGESAKPPPEEQSLLAEGEASAPPTTQQPTAPVAKPAAAQGPAPAAPVSAGAAAMAAVADPQPEDPATAKPAAAAPAAATGATTSHAPKPAPPNTAAAAPAQKPATATAAVNGSKTAAAVPPRKSDSPPPPLKALTFRHLEKKYADELNYMLVEFRKLERQLLGAPLHRPDAAHNPSHPKPEGAGSKERREKLHGFILHLEETIRQIGEGCALEEKERSERTQKRRQPSEEPKEGEGQDEGAGNNAQQLPTENFTAADAALSQLTPAKEKEESVQRLEEHVLANLLPVKVRLTKQLAAQKGAAKNPATAPVQPGKPAAAGGAAAGAGKGSFAAAAEAKRKAQEKAIELQKEKQRQREEMERQRQAGGPAPTPSQYGKPFGGARSSLTSRLHGRVLGATAAASPAAGAPGAAAGAGAADPTAPASAPGQRRPILYAGMAPGSTQVPSSVDAVAGVHPGLIGRDAARAVAAAEDERRRLRQLEEGAARVAMGAAGAAATAEAEGPATLAARARAAAAGGPASGNAQPSAQKYQPAPPPAPARPKKPHAPPKFDDPALAPEQRAELRLREARWRQGKRRRERRRQRKRRVGGAVLTREHAQAVGAAGARAAAGEAPPTAAAPTAPPAPNGPPGPRRVEYVCALCNDPYPSLCDANPWWALTRHACPKCGKAQIPRLDISAPANAAEYPPALVAPLDEGRGGGHGGMVEVGGFRPPPPAARPAHGAAPHQASGGSDSDVSFTDESDGEGGSGRKEGGPNYDESSDEDEEGDAVDDEDTVAREERAEREEFGRGYRGEALGDDRTRRLLVLMEHASTCPGRHACAKHRNVCHSTKYLMLHVRDCNGLLPNGDICPFPWCRKVKHLLYHLVSCEAGKSCTICRPEGLSPNLAALAGLNAHRRSRFNERVKAVLAKRHQMAQQAAAAATANATAAHQPARPAAAAPVPPKATAPRATPAPSNAPAATPRGVAAPAKVTSAPAPAVPAPTAIQQLSASHRQAAAAQQHPPSTAPPPAALRPATAAAALAAAAPPHAATLDAAAPAPPSPALAAAPLAGMPSTLSISGLPTLDEALEMGELGSHSMADLMAKLGDEHVGNPEGAAARTAN